MALTFESVDEILWCDHSNETSLPVLIHGAICFSKFYKRRFANLVEICLWLHLAVKGLMIISLLLITLSLDKVWILLGENWCWSTLGHEGLTQISTFTLNSLNEKYPFGKKMPAILQHKAFSGLPAFSFHNFHVNSAVRQVNTKSTERPNFCQPNKHCMLSSVNPSTSRVNKLKVSRKVVLTFETMNKILWCDCPFK